MIGIGSVVNGKYRLVRLLGDGGMGSVYEAQHAMLGTRVALKMLHPELGGRTGLVERFMQEARVAAQIRSAHVVQVTDVDRTPEGNAYIVMELLEGEPLSSVLDRQRKLAVAVACEYATQILEALEAAHAIGVIHRDLKPENVFVTFAGGKPVLKLIDFGIAKARRIDVQAKKLTVAGVVMGTAEYMAPEQAYSADKVDARSDIYAAGVMLYEMIAGVRPVSGGDARGIAWKVQRGDVVPLVQAAPDAPREIAGLVHRAMAARPELRFATATEMRLALHAVLGAKGPPTGLPAGRTPAGKTVELTHPVARSSSGAITGSGSVGPVEGESHADTIRAPPIATALASSPYAPASAAPVEALATGPRPSRLRNANVALVTIPLVLGAAVVALVVGTGRCTSSAPAPVTATAEPIAVEAGPAAVAPDVGSAAQQDVPALAPTRASANRSGPPLRGAAAQPPANEHGGPALGLPSALPVGAPGFPTAFPSVLPSALPLPEGFPTALPSGFPTALPSAFPSVLPSVLPAWPPPPPPSSASASSMRPEDRTY